jgi:antitoxin component YwqK of YwqJK toxin-antitoxin module
MPVAKKVSTPVLILTLLLSLTGLSEAGKDAHGIHTEKRDGFSIRVPNNWERTLTPGNQADTHLFVSPDKQVAVGVSVYSRAGSRTKAALLDLFQAEGLSGSKQLQEQSTALNGRGGLLRAYVLPGDGDPIIAVAIAISAAPRGYVVWHMIPAPLFETRKSQANAVLDTFLIRPEAASSSGASATTTQHAPAASRATGDVPDFFGGGAPSAAADRAGTTKTQTPKPAQAAETQPGSVPDFFGDSSSATPALRVATQSAPAQAAPPASSKTAGKLDLKRFPLFMDYDLNNIPPSLAACPSARDLPMPAHDNVKESVGADGYTRREYRKNGAMVASKRLKNGALKSVMLWTPERKGRVYVEFWDDETVRKVDYLEGMDKQGICRFWDTDGTLAQIVTYRDNKQDGPPKIVWLRNQNHTLRSVEYRRQGKRHGVRRTYHRNGRLEEESHWENGTMMRQKLYFSSGQLKHEMRRENGKSIGSFYNKDGTIKSTYK